MIATTTKQKKTLKDLDQKLSSLKAQIDFLAAQKNAYVLSIIEGLGDGEKEYELNKNYDLEEVKEEDEEV